MTTARHTATPWEVTQVGQIASSKRLIATMDKYWADWEDDALHIVKCVNSHDKLVEALKLLHQRIWSGVLLTDKDWPKVKEQVEQALAEVE